MWACDAEAQERCQESENGLFTSKKECQLYCYSNKDFVFTYENITKFYDGDIKFPVPEEFVKRVFKGDLYVRFRNYIRKGEHKHTGILLRTCQSVFTIPVMMNTDCKFSRSVFVSRKYHENLMTTKNETVDDTTGLDADETADYRSHTPVVNAVFSNPPEKRDHYKINPSTGMELVIVAYLDNPHAGCVIVNHDHKHIIKFEPHTGRGALWEYLSECDRVFYTNIAIGCAQLVSRLVGPTGYTFEDTFALSTASFQSDDPYCLSWSYFIACTHAINSHLKTFAEVNSLLLMGGSELAKQYLHLFMFWLSTLSIDVSNEDASRDLVVLSLSDLSSLNFLDWLSEHGVDNGAVNKIDRYMWRAVNLYEKPEIKASDLVFSHGFIVFCKKIKSVMENTDDDASKLDSIAQICMLFPDVDIVTHVRRNQANCLIS